MPDQPTPQALKARSIPAWGEAPGLQSERRTRAEGPIYKIVLRPVILAITLLAVAIGCSRKIDIKVFQTPTTGLSFTEEIYRGQGAIDNDYTNVYLRFERNGKSDKQLVLSGTYVELKQVKWLGPNEATLCMQPGGFTSEFHSRPTLIVGDSVDNSESIHFLLREDC